MSGAARCPISTERIDDSAARVNGGITLGVLAIGTLTPAHWVLLLLVVDFAIKVFVGFANSPSCWISRRISSALGLQCNMVDAAPKRFASVVALVMSSAALLMLYGFGSLPLFYAFAGTFAVFAFLECVLGFCMGCVMFTLLPDRMAVAFVRKGR